MNRGGGGIKKHRNPIVFANTLKINSILFLNSPIIVPVGVVFCSVYWRVFLMLKYFNIVDNQRTNVIWFRTVIIDWILSLINSYGRANLKMIYLHIWFIDEQWKCHRGSVKYLSYRNDTSFAELSHVTDTKQGEQPAGWDAALRHAAPKQTGGLLPARHFYYKALSLWWVKSPSKTFSVALAAAGLCEIAFCRRRPAIIQNTSGDIR